MQSSRSSRVSRSVTAPLSLLDFGRIVTACVDHVLTLSKHRGLHQADIYVSKAADVSVQPLRSLSASRAGRAEGRQLSDVLARWEARVQGLQTSLAAARGGQDVSRKAWEEAVDLLLEQSRLLCALDCELVTVLGDMDARLEKAEHRLAMHARRKDKERRAQQEGHSERVQKTQEHHRQWLDERDALLEERMRLQMEAATREGRLQEMEAQRAARLKELAEFEQLVARLEAENEQVRGDNERLAAAALNAQAQVEAAEESHAQQLARTNEELRATVRALESAQDSMAGELTRAHEEVRVAREVLASAQRRHKDEVAQLTVRNAELQELQEQALARAKRQAPPPQPQYPADSERVQQLREDLAQMTADSQRQRRITRAMEEMLNEVTQREQAKQAQIEVLRAELVQAKVSSIETRSFSQHMRPADHIDAFSRCSSALLNIARSMDDTTKTVAPTDDLHATLSILSEASNTTRLQHAMGGDARGRSQSVLIAPRAPASRTPDVLATVASDPQQHRHQTRTYTNVSVAEIDDFESSYALSTDMLRTPPRRSPHNVRSSPAEVDSKLREWELELNSSSASSS